MKLLEKKIRSNTGATLIIAIVFMMFCIFIGGSILAAASANGARVEKAVSAEQEYLSLRSAALLLNEELRAGNDKGTSLNIVNDDGNVSYSLTNRRNNLRELLYVCAARQYCEQQQALTGTSVTETNHIAFINLGSYYGPSNYPEVKMSGGYACFDFSVQVKKDGGVMETVTARLQCAPDYTVYVLFSTDGGENFSSALHLKMKSNVIGGAGTAIIWNDPVIVKGGI